jgi:hypothetical protein
MLVAKLLSIFIPKVKLRLYQNLTLIHFKSDNDFFFLKKKKSLFWDKTGQSRIYSIILLNNHLI